MRNLFLTINVDCQDEYFLKMEGVQKLNMRDVIKLSKLSLKPGELEGIRGKLVAKTILEISGDLLIGFAIKQNGQLNEIVKSIKSHNLTISKIFYDGGKRRESKIMKYRKQYKLHSRWMDYSPEFIEHTYEEFDKVVEALKLEAKENNVEIEAI